MNHLPYTASEGGQPMGHTMARAEAEIVALGSIIGSIVGALPYIVTLLAAIWYCINIYESTPVQAWLAKRRLRKIGTKAYEKAVADLPEAVPMPVAVAVGAVASAKAVIAEKHNIETKEEEHGSTSP